MFTFQKKSMAARTLPARPLPKSLPLRHPALPALLTLCLCLAACSHNVTPMGRYQTTPVVADGISDDWTLPLRFANASYTLQYNITNDSRNIYVCVLTRDDETILRILRAGITVYFDPKGKEGRDISLHYPLRKQPDPNIRNSNGAPPTTPNAPVTNVAPPASGNDSALKQELLRQSDSYGTAGFSGIDNGQFAAGDPKGPIRLAIRLSHHDNTLFYEAIIPIANILGTDLGSRSPKKPFSVGVVLNTPSGQTVAGDQHHSGANRHGLGLGMNGMHMGNGSSHRNSGKNNYDNPPIREDANWYQFRLATRA